MKIGGKEVKEIVQQFGTPVYIYDEDKLRGRMKEFTGAFRSDLFETGVLYASKAFSCKEVVRMANEYGMCLDVVSGGEMYTAEKAGFPMEKVFFHGNNKSISEIEYGIQCGVGTFVVDNLMEAEVLAEMAKDSDHVIHTLIRTNPGIEAHTHKYIVTAHVDSKFGISNLDEEELVQTIRTLQNAENIAFDGLHCHIGSQIFDVNAFTAAVSKMFAIALDLKNKYGVECNTLNFGGGFAAYYTNADAPIPVNEVCAAILKTCEEEKKKTGLGITRVLIEPGRSIVAESGFTAYTAGFMKKTPNKNYIFVDGGMADNIRPALYQAEYEAVIDGKEEDEAEVTYTIAGKCCESGDIVIPEIRLPKCERGDIIITKTTGAYGYSMSSHYNKIATPAVVFVSEGNAREVIERESYEHMIAMEK